MATKNIDIVINAKDNASKAFDSLWDKIKKNLNTIKIASGAISAWVVALWKKFLDASIENEPLQKSFERLSESAWIASKDMLDAMRKASQWTVADTNLMAQANKAYALWIVNSAEDMATMIEIARLKWQAMGRTMEEALGDITTWLWRWSAQILDNLWIVINAEEVNEKYAQSIWKTAKELTDAEKKQALVNAVVEQWRKELEEAGEVQLTMQEKIAKLNATRENTKNVIGDALVPVLDKLLTAITPIIEKVAKWIEENPELTANLLLVAWALAWLTFACTTIIPAITTIVWLLSWPAWRIALLWLVVGWLYALDEKVMTTDEQIALYNQELENTRLAYENWEITLEEYLQKTQEVSDKIAEAEAKHRTFWGYMKDQFFWILHTILHPIESTRDLWKDIKYRVNQWEVALLQWGISIAKDVIPIIDKLVWYLRDAWNWLQKVASMLWNWISSAKSTVSWRVDSAKSLVWFANGWSVQGNVPILVGEKWPEVFVPSSSWTIVPNRELWWINVNVNFGWVAINNWSDETLLAQIVSDTITRNLELYQKGIY